MEWRKKYGDIYTMYIGMQPLIVINSFEKAYKYIVKEGDVFSGRSVNAFNLIIRGGDYGIIDTEGPLWLEHRRFALKVFREFGMSKTQMEDRVLAEVEYIFDRIDQDIQLKPDDINVEHYTDIAVGSVINAVVCGYRYTDGKEHEFYRLKEILGSSNESLANIFGLFVMFNAQIFKIPGFKFIEKYIENSFGTVMKHLHNEIKRHLDENDYNNESMEAKDYIDAYLLEKFRLERNGETDHTFTDQQLVNVCLDLWIAGQETTSVTLAWAISHLVAHPEVQKRAHEELDRVIGPNRLITMADRKDLHYINAIVHESQRCGNIIAINLTRKTSEDIVMDGMLIKKGSVVVPQVSVIMNDPEAFPEPEKFKPKRFLDESGKFRQIEQMIPFSLGKRACLGEGLARMELFLITANLLNRYRLSAGRTPPTLRKVAGMMPKTHPFTCRVEKRH
ncbi:unnamed protein product [Bursaphelenchus xylophilus]|uniref:(pine wood nematode) hypothetical protein n=1 Tax=Bursaphelenchus xylophilus TaxID=6326 RepID=A0A1I7S583_BURXY|nr:unnamed protein product [Bursaphelenchus xylophilus]CAG9117803.1 unnamed protein product [Bursaphelenchus xylophilus]